MKIVGVSRRQACQAYSAASAQYGEEQRDERCRGASGRAPAWGRSLCGYFERAATGVSVRRRTKRQGTPASPQALTTASSRSRGRVGDRDEHLVRACADQHRCDLVRRAEHGHPLDPAAAQRRVVVEKADHPRALGPRGARARGCARLGRRRRRARAAGRPARAARAGPAATRSSEPRERDRGGAQRLRRRAKIRAGNSPSERVAAIDRDSGDLRDEARGDRSRARRAPSRSARRAGRCGSRRKRRSASPARPAAPRGRVPRCSSLPSPPTTSR